jgi:hypothetical protein
VWNRKCFTGVVRIVFARPVIAVVLLALVIGAAALGFAAGGHANSTRPPRNIDLHWGDHLLGDAVKVSCGYSLDATHQQRPHLYCFGPGTNGSDPELFVEWTRGAVHVTRCWNDCAAKEVELLTVRR